MSAMIENLLGRYEGGQMTRRDLVLSLSAMMVAQRASAQSRPAAAPFPGRTLNHLTLRVSDTERSIAFYQKLFGISVLTRQHEGGTAVLPIGNTQYLILHGSDVAPHLNHFCIGIDNFDPDKTIKTLAEFGIKGNVNMRPSEDSRPPTKAGPAAELLFRDPDGLPVQISDVRYRGGTGLLGDIV